MIQNIPPVARVKHAAHTISLAAAIAALYVLLTFLANAFGLANGTVQIRFSEALTVLPALTPAAIPGLFLGCLLSNLLTGCLPWDVLIGSLATLFGAICTYLLAKLPHGKWAAALPPILANTLAIPPVLAFVYHAQGTLPFFFLTVLAGECISCGILGTVLLTALLKIPKLQRILRSIT